MSLALHAEDVAAGRECADADVLARLHFTLADALRRLGLQPGGQRQDAQRFDLRAHLEKISDPEHWRRKRGA